MKVLLVVALCFVVASVAWARPDEEHYTDEFDSLDEDEVLKNDRVFDNYFNCLKTGKKCPKAAAVLREVLPEALKTKCGKCTAVQKEKAPKIIKWIITNKPDEWLEIEEIFDKEHIYRTDYAEELKKEGVTLPALKS